MYPRSPAVRQVSAVSPDRRMDPVQNQSWQPWLKQAARSHSYKGPMIEAMKAAAVPMRPQSPPPRMTYTNALCAEIRPDPRTGALSPIHQRNSGPPQVQMPVTQVPAQVPTQNVNYFEKQIPQQTQPPVAFDEAMTARPGMGRRLEWQVDSVPLQGAGSMSAMDGGSQPTSCHLPLMSPMRYRRESGKPMEPTGTPQAQVKRGNSEGSLPSSARREKAPDFDLEKKIVEEVNRVLESRLAAKEDTDCLKKELEKAMDDREIEAQQVQHLTERLIEMEQRLEREADARRKVQAKLDQGVLIESELHQKDMKISELERKLKAKADEARNLKVRQDRLEKQVDDTRALRDKSVRDRDCWLREREGLVQDKLQEKRDLEEKVFAAQTRSRNLEHRCQELEETLKQERNNEQLLHAQKDLEQRESLLNSRNQELQARLLEAERNTEELQRLRLELQVNKQQLDEKEADLTQQKNEWKLRAQEREQKYRNWESQRQEVEQQNERTAKELQSMVQQSQEKIMEEVRKRTALEKDLRQLNEEKLRINEERAKLNQEKGQLGEQQTKLHEEKAKLQEHIEQQKLEIGNLQKQVDMEHSEVVTPCELKRRALAQDSDLSKRNAELMHDVAAFELEMKWLASCNSVLRQHVPTELEATVKAAIENLNGSDWQPPSEEADDVFNVDLGRRAKLPGEIPLLHKAEL
ncbi:unnamed protein product [Symbiodinium sp. CCMP2592]|nr:unnamed protein product [Symbiodinium sp. CCMP2592]